MPNLYRLLPAVDHALLDLESDAALANLPRPLLRDLVNRFLDLRREDIRQGTATRDDLDRDRLMPRLRAFVLAQSRPHFRRVLNGTGVVVHTNLGRSLLARQAVEAVTEACAHYSNLEFSLETGERGSRYSHVEDLLCRLTGAEAALVVNNNASAVLLILETLAKGREVVVSRGQLVEIGGSFRIPEVMARSGAILREVGATNRTHLRDYESAIGPETAVLMKVHTSNYRIVGFTGEVALKDLAELGRSRGLPVVEDLGSGNLFDFASAGLTHLADEPTVQDAVATGADVISFSGDKVLGGPQAGIIVGRKRYIDLIKRNPVNRAMRIDKMTLAALEATLRLYLDPDLARREVPTLRMITASPGELRAKARRLASVVRKSLGDSLDTTLLESASRVGGGAFPERDLPTTLVGLKPKAPDLTGDGLRERLLRADPPLVGRIETDMFCLDPRTLEPEENRLVVAALAQALRGE